MTGIATTLAALQRASTVIDLSRPMTLGMPQSPNHPQYRLSMPRRHGDATRADGGSAANDLLVTGTHVGTHIDALGHVSHCGQLHDHVDAEATQRGGRLSRHGVEEIEPIVTRGLLLDVPATRGVDRLAGGDEITPADLDAALEHAGTTTAAGDVLLVRSGWGQLWGEGEAYLGRESGVPGVGEAGARWLADQGARAVGADTIAFECLPAGAGHALLPAHRLLLVEEGIYIIETLDLEGLSEQRCYEFLFVCTPLHLVGATGSPVRPLAIAP